MKQVICLGLLVVMGISSSWQGCWAIGEDDPLWNKPTYEKKVHQVGQALLKANHIEEKVVFRIEYGKGKDKVNAYAEQDYAHVTVLEGLLKYIESDDELAAVLGHEIGHIILRHDTHQKVQSIATNTLLTAPLVVVGAFGGPVGMFLGAKLGRGINHTLLTQTNRSLESDADAYGLQLMINAGYNPEAMESLFTKISGDGSKWNIWRTHPMGSKRITDVHQMIIAWQNQKKAPTALPQQQQALPAPATVQTPQPSPQPSAVTTAPPVKVSEQKSVSASLDTNIQHVPDYLKKYATDAESAEETVGDDVGDVDE